MLVAYDWQSHDIRKALKEPTRGVLNATVMGGGKTLFGVEIAKAVTKKQCLVIGPRNTEDSWRSTFGIGELFRRISSVSGENHEYHAAKEFMAGVPGIYFANWETAIRLDYAKFKCDVVIFDEIHRASSHKAAHRAGSNAHLAYTVGRGVALRDGWRIGLSGTWKSNKEEGAWAVMRAIWPLQTEPSFWKWSHKHLTIEDKIIVVNGRRQEVKVLGDELSPGSIIKSLPGKYIRHEEQERCCKFHPKGVQADLPARIAHFVGVDLSTTQRQIYDSLEESMFAWIKDNDYPISSEGWPMVNMIRMHQVCLAVPSTELAKRLKTDERTGEKVEQDYIAVKYPLGATSSKIDALCDIVADIPPDESIIVYTHSAGIIPVVTARLGKQLRQPDAVRAWHGAIPADERATIKADFIAKRTRIIVAQVASIGEGTDGLQHVCHSEIWLSQSANGLINQQAIKRLHRPGQQHLINAFYVYARGTLEKEQYEKLAMNAGKMRDGLKARKGKKRDR